MTDTKAYFAEMMRNNPLAMDTIALKRTEGVPTARVHIMQHEYIERVAGVEPGAYLQRPEEVYIACMRNTGANILYQFIPLNPMRIGNTGYERKDQRSAVSSEIKSVADGIEINSPEDVVEHMERFVFPRLAYRIKAFDEGQRVEEILKYEKEVQDKIGHDLLKLGCNTVKFPLLKYGQYGYEAYFMAYALYPEIIEKDFSLEADLATLNNRAIARACREGNLPPVCWLGHDMAASKGTLASMASLEKLWFPHFARCLEPALKAGVKMVWHCDGNLMEMLPRLLDVGLHGFQGFQYEDGMDYEKICRMKTRDGEGLIIWAGVSVTTTLPSGTPEDVKKELAWLVENGSDTGLFLGASSAVAPGTPWENIKTLLEGLTYYRERGQ
jgi:hypothetical protein